jgi:sialate O-acetylesterase
MKKSLTLLAAFASLASAPCLRADIKLPALISDHMVLQQEAKANVWGKADAGEKVTVKLGDKTGEATADKDGKWSLRLAGLKAGVIGDMTITGKNSLTVKDVAAGEVWVCSGQSNMEMIVQDSKDAATEIAAANFPLIRHFLLTKAVKEEPTEDCTGKWEICSPQTVGRFTAVGYFFGRDLHQKLNAPIGLIHTSWGGTPAEFWTPSDVIAANPTFKARYIDRWAKTKADYPQAKAAYDEAIKKWKADIEQAKTENKPPPSQPGAPRGGDAFGAPSCLYNAMIVPVLPYTIQGVIWYQGESNASEAQLYRALFPTMIVSWRRAWAKAGLAEAENPEFPFLFVQLANFLARHEEPTNSQWAELREAQLFTLELPHTGMAVIIDIGDEKDIHPKNKQDVGHRLALAAEATVYYIDTEFSGPIISGSQLEEGKVRLSFRNAEGMKAASGDKIKGFAVAGEDRKFVWANVEIQGDHVLVSSPTVPTPVAVRYGWADNPDCNLINAAGLPASPFRTDDWK